MSGGKALPAFGGYGIELEYAIVDADTLNVRPIADRLLRAMAGHDVSSVERGELGWSNELVLHVIELKNLAPSPSLARLPALFEEEIRSANRMLDAMAARQLPVSALADELPQYAIVDAEGKLILHYDRPANVASMTPDDFAAYLEQGLKKGAP